MLSGMIKFQFVDVQQMFFLPKAKFLKMGVIARISRFI
jgi:hypothetical protein